MLTDIEISEIEAKIEYSFKNKSLLRQAFIHSSYAKCRGEEYNERLEFLGDSILGFTVAEHLYYRFKNWDEGKLSDQRQKLVNNDLLCKIVEELELDKYLTISETQEISPKMRANIFEALIGAVYLDDKGKVKEFILRFIK